MKRCAAVVLAACSAARPEPPIKPLTTDDWIRRCGDRFEVARLTLVRIDKAFIDGAVTVDGTPHNPHVRFDLHVKPDGFFGAQVEHGSAPCLDFDPEPTIGWRNGHHDIVLDRIRRFEGDEAWIEGNRVSPASADFFRREMERAIDVCLLDARGVPLGKLPPDISCGDKLDKCPDSPTDDDDGCPKPVQSP